MNILEEERKFNVFINKTIIFSSKQFYKKEMRKNTRENSIEELTNDIRLKEMLSVIDFSYDTIENNIILLKAMKSLTEIEQKVIFLLFRKDLSRKVVADKVKIDVATVSRVQKRALLKMKKFLEGDIKNV